MSKAGWLKSLRSGELIIIPRGGRKPLRVPAFAGHFEDPMERPDLPRTMRKLVRAMVALKAQARKKK